MSARNTTAKRPVGRPPAAKSAAKPIKKVAAPAPAPRSKTVVRPAPPPPPPPAQLNNDDLFFPELPTDMAPATPFIPAGPCDPVINGTFDEQNADVYDYVNQHTPLRTPALYPFLDDTQDLPEITSSQIEESNQLVEELIRKSNSPPVQQQQSVHDDDEDQSDEEEQEEEQPEKKPEPSRKRNQRKETEEEEPKSDAKRPRTVKPRPHFEQAIPDEQARYELCCLCRENPEFYERIRLRFIGLTQAYHDYFPEEAKRRNRSRRPGSSASSSSSTSFPRPRSLIYTHDEFWKNFSLTGNPLWDENDPEKLEELCPERFSRFSGCERLPVFERNVIGAPNGRFFSLVAKHLFQLQHRSNEAGPISDRAKMLFINRNDSTIRPILPILSNIINFDECVAHSNTLSTHPEIRQIAQMADAYLDSLISVIPNGFSQMTLCLLNEQHNGFNELKKVLHPTPYTFIALPFPSSTASRSPHGPNHRLRFQCEYGDDRQFTFLRSAEESDRKEGNQYRSIQLGTAYHVLPFFNGAVTTWGSELSTNFDTPILLIMVQ